MEMFAMGEDTVVMVFSYLVAITCLIAAVYIGFWLIAKRKKKKE